MRDMPVSCSLLMQCSSTLATALILETLMYRQVAVNVPLLDPQPTVSINNKYLHNLFFIRRNHMRLLMDTT